MNISTVSPEKRHEKNYPFSNAVSVIMCVALCTFYGSVMWSSYLKRWFAVYVSAGR